MKPLSRRENQVLTMLANGLYPKQIASLLCLSGAAVKKYSTRAKEKFQAKSTYHMIALAVLAGQVDIKSESAEGDNAGAPTY